MLSPVPARSLFRNLRTMLMLLVASLSAHAQTFTVLHAFSGAPDGAYPADGVFIDASGNVYGTTVTGGDPTCSNYPQPPGCGAIFKIDGSGTESILYSFGHGHGDSPYATVVRDAAGNLYGTTLAGGHFLYGTVFKLDVAGNETIIHNFDSHVANLGKGILPYDRVRLDSKGNLYGTTYAGGNGTGGASTGMGVVFTLTQTGIETVLYKFDCPVCGTGTGSGFGYPMSGVIRDSEDNFYGMTPTGGLATTQCTWGCGVVYKIEKHGLGTILYAFTGGTTDGAYPTGELIRDAAGNLYGTTREGGGNACGDALGCGTVFKLDAEGNETILYRFTGNLDGGAPSGGLVRDSHGNFYGTTQFGGANTNLPCGASGCGVVFKLKLNGEESVLHSFNGTTDGIYPNPNLTIDSGGSLYGTTSQGGTTCFRFGQTCGVVFKITQP